MRSDPAPSGGGASTALSPSTCRQRPSLREYRQGARHKPCPRSIVAHERPASRLLADRASGGPTGPRGNLPVKLSGTGGTRATVREKNYPKRNFSSRARVGVGVGDAGPVCVSSRRSAGRPSPSRPCRVDAGLPANPLSVQKVTASDGGPLSEPCRWVVTAPAAAPGRPNAPPACGSAGSDSASNVIDSASNVIGALAVWAQCLLNPIGCGRGRVDGCGRRGRVVDEEVGGGYQGRSQREAAAAAAAAGAAQAASDCRGGELHPPGRPGPRPGPPLGPGPKPS